MKKLLWFSILLSLILSFGSVYATPVNCTPTGPGNLTTVVGGYSYPPATIPPGIGSLACGPVVFSNFQATDASGGNTTGLHVDFLGAGQSYWDPATGIANIALNPNFTASAAQDIHYFFDVSVVGGGKIDQVDLQVGGTNAAINERVCSGNSGPANMNAGSGVCVSTQLAVLSASSGGTAAVAVVPASSSLGVFKDIGKSSGELTSLSQSFHVAGVPEPATFAFMGAGLILFALARRKRA